MDEYETDRASHRANLIEQRMFELTLNTIDTQKHSTAIELRKAQNDMKKRLHRYRNRQREIVKSRPDSDRNRIEDMLTRQMTNRSKSKHKRPQTCPGQVQTLKSRETFDTDSESDIEIDGSFMIDQQRSKIDLRPKTSMSLYRTGSTLDKYIRVGRLGPAVRQIRYFDEDELKDRGHFYMHLVDKRIDEERSKLNSLDEKVAEFCGKETIQTMHKKMMSKKRWFKRSPGDNNETSTCTKRTLAPGQFQTSIQNHTQNTSNVNKTRKTQVVQRASSATRPNTSSGIRLQTQSSMSLGAPIQA